MEQPNRFQKLVADAKQRIIGDLARRMRVCRSGGGSAVLIDVREADDWREGHASGAKHLSRGIIELEIEEQVPTESADRSATAAAAAVRRWSPKPAEDGLHECEIDGGWAGRLESGRSARRLCRLERMKTKAAWLNRTVLGIGLASLFSDWSHEIATAAMPAFLATLGVAAAWLGIIEGVSDGLASFAKMASGYYTDGLRRRKPIAVAGYLATALGTASFGLATNAWHVLFARAGAWLGRGFARPYGKPC